MTWNVQGRVGDWEARHRALRSWIERTAPDVLTLQESWVERDGATQAQRFGAELGMHAVTAADLAGFDRYPEAPYWVVNAVLARWPLTIERLAPLPDEHGEPTWRHVLVTRVHRPDDEGGPFVAAGTHLEHGLENSARRGVQMAALVNHLAESLGDAARRRESLPAVLGGDLNCTPESDEYRCATGHSPGGGTELHPRRRVDGGGQHRPGTHVVGPQPVGAPLRHSSPSPAGLRDGVHPAATRCGTYQPMRTGRPLGGRQRLGQ